MCANWADNSQKSENSVQVLLEPVKNQFVTDNKGGVAGYNFGAYDEYVSAIESYIRFNSEIPEPEKFKLLSNAVWAAAKAKQLDAKNLLVHIKNEEGNYLGKPKENYEFISSLSVKYFERLNRNNLKPPPIKFTQKLPKKFDFQSILEPFSYIDIKPIPESYTLFRISIKARNPNEAYYFGIDTIDFLRAIWNWYNEPTEYLFNSDQSLKPTNLITLGPFHTILKPNGELFKDFWYETEYQESTLDISKKWNDMKQYENRVRRKISRHPYKEEIKDLSIRFVRALDHKDKQISFLALWQVLEKAMGINNADYDKLIKRVSFLYEEVELNKAVLQHLRMHRNASVHDGTQKNRIQKYFYQLWRYVRTVLDFHIVNPFKVNSLSEAFSYLDLPPDSTILTSKFAQFRKAIKYRSKTSPET